MTEEGCARSSANRWLLWQNFCVGRMHSSLYNVEAGGGTYWESGKL